MKISYSNYSTLKILKEKKINRFKLDEKDYLDFHKKPVFVMEKVFEHFNYFLPSFSENVFLVSNSFYEAFEKSADKMLDLYENTILNKLSEFNISGTYIVKELVWMVNLQKKENQDLIDVGIYIFDKEQRLQTILISNIKDNNFIKDFFWDSRKPFPTEKDKWTLVGAISIINMFQKYAEIETQFIMPKTKSNNIKCIYNNQTDLKITQLDCTWFTNIIRSEGFKVRGHFRLQPYADGTKKIIWINEFQKNGYSLTPKMLKNNDN